MLECPHWLSALRASPPDSCNDIISASACAAAIAYAETELLAASADCLAALFSAAVCFKVPVEAVAGCDSACEEPTCLSLAMV